MAAKPKKHIDTNLAPQFEVLTNWLRVLYPLQCQFDILGATIEFGIIDYNWISFNLLVRYMQDDKSSTLGQSVGEFRIPCVFTTTPEEAYKMVFDECQKRKVRPATVPIEWLRKKDSEMYMGTEWEVYKESD